MEAIQRRPSSARFRAFLGTRRGALTVAAVSAAAAGLLLFAYLERYRASVNGGVVPTTVLVAERLIPKGTAGDAVIAGGLYETSTVAKDQVREGAFADPQGVAGRVATRDILPGQQIAAADFARGADPLRGQLAAQQRAISVPLDAAHGLVGDIRAGDRIDVMAGFNSLDGASGRGQPLLKVIMRDILVLKAPPVVEGAETKQRDVANVMLRATERQAAELAYASDNGKVWLVLRPPSGAKDSTRPPAVSLQSLVGARPIEATP